MISDPQPKPRQNVMFRKRPDARHLPAPTAWLATRPPAIKRAAGYRRGELCVSPNSCRAWRPPFYGQ
jgi:hypothetical protein